MRILLSISILFVWVSANATHFLIGSGSGSVSLTSMVGHSPGDSALITTGSYTSGTFDHLNGIIILPQSGRSYFTGTVEFSGNTGVEFGYVSFTGTSNGMDMRAFSSRGGNDNNCYLHHLAFLNLGTSCILAHGNWLYTQGDSTTLAWYKNKFDSITEIACNELIEGSFGSPSDNAGRPPDVFDSTIITRFLSMNTSATSTSGEPGTESRGIQFRCNYNHWAILNNRSLPPHGDVGKVYGHGSGTFSYIYTDGGPGYILRLAPCSEVSNPRPIIFFNNGKFNSSEYGMISPQVSPSDTVTGKFMATDVYIYNNTQGNASDQISYWCQIAVVGNTFGKHIYIRNNLGFNISTSGKPNHIIMNQSPDWNSIATDTSNNQYWPNASVTQVDSLTVLFSNSMGNFYSYAPTSGSPSIPGFGTINPFSSTDFSGKPYNLVIGYLGLGVFPPSCQCISIPRSSKASFL